MLKKLLRPVIKQRVITFLWFFLPLMANGQAAERIFDGEVINFKANSNVFGNYLLYDNWKLGTIEDTDGDLTHRVQLNYNTYNKTFLSLLEDNQVLELNKYLYKKISFDKDTFINLATHGLPGYGRVIYNGSKIKCFEVVEGRKTTTNSQAYNAVESKYQIVRKKITWLILNDEVIELKRKRKFLEKFFPKEELKKLKSNHPDLNEDEDLRAILYYFDK